MIIFFIKYIKGNKYYCLYVGLKSLPSGEVFRLTHSFKLRIKKSWNTKHEVKYMEN